MRSNLTTLGLSLSAVAAFTACRTDPPVLVRDLAMMQQGGDDAAMSTSEDMAQVQGMTATLNAIDTNTVAKGTVVTVSNLVLIGLANNAGHSKSSLKCEYSAYLQDPAGPAPAGIKLFVTGAVCMPTELGCKCPFPPNSGTVIDQLSDPTVKLGDVFDITGKVDTYNPASDGGLQPTQHEIDVTGVVSKGMNMSITPLVVKSPADFAVNGAGYAANESMLVTITPAMPTAIGTLDKFKGFNFAGAYMGGDYNFAYSNKGMFPPPGGLFKSITGIAEMAFGGSVAPRTMADFQQ